MSEVNDLVGPLYEAAYRKVKKGKISRKDARHLLPMAMALLAYYGGNTSDMFFSLEEEAIKADVSSVEIDRIIEAVRRIVSDLPSEDRASLYTAAFGMYGDGKADYGGKHAVQEQSVAV